MPKISELPAGTTPTGTEKIAAVQGGVTVELTALQIGNSGTFLQAGTGAVTRTVQNKERDFVSVKDFGATGDGGTDDTASIILADVYAASVGKSLYFPGGNYVVSSTITPSEGAHWIGASTGATSFYMSSTTATLFAISNAGIEMEGFRVLPQTTRTSSAVTFLISCVGYVCIHDVATVFNGISFKLTSNSTVADFDRISTNSTVAGGIDVSISGCFIGTFSNYIFTGVTSGTRSAQHFLLTNLIQIQLLNGNAFQADQGILIAPGNGQSVTQVKIDTTYSDTNPSGSLNIAPTGTGNVGRISYVNGWMEGSTTGSLINITGGGSTVVDEVYIANNELVGTSGGSVLTSTSATRVSLKDNRLINIATSPAITIDGTVGCDITGNKVTGTAAGIVDVSLLNATDKCLIHDNDFSGQTAPISNTSSGTQNSIGNNIGYKPMGELASGQIWVGQAAITTLQAKTVSGDATLAASGALTLASAISAAGPIGTATAAPVITYDAKGRLTTVTTVTITPAIGSVTGLGTGIATALAVNTGSAGAPVLFNGAGGTPSSLVGTNITGTAAGLTAGTASAVAVGGITGLGTGVATALAINVGSAGAPVTFNGALGTPSSGTVTNLTGTASININGTVGATSQNSGQFTSLAYSTTLTGTSTNASALAVGRLGATTPALQVDASTATSITGVKVKSAASGGGVAVSAIGETNVNLAVDAAGSGTIVFGATSTGAITLTRATTMSAALTYGGVTLTNNVTGTGKMVLDTSPVFVTPALGTPASGVATNLTGTAASLTAGNVTTNANLTGVITSVGNATSIASQTGTGTKFVVDTSPTINTPAIAGIASYTESHVPAGAGSVYSLSGSVTRSSGGTGGDTYFGYNFGATDNGSTNPAQFVANQFLGTWNNSSNTVAFNSVVQSQANITANVTTVNNFNIGATAFGGTVGTYNALNITSPGSGGGTFTNKNAILIANGSGPIAQSDVTDSTTTATGAIQNAGGFGLAKSMVYGGLIATSAAAPTIASAGTIAPTKPITFISGVAAIATITPPSPISLGGGQITLIPTGIFTTTAAGNIAIASTAVVSKALILTYDVTTTKWYPSY